MAKRKTMTQGAQALLEYRAELGLSLMQLAVRLDVDKSTAAHWLAGDTRPDRTNAGRVAAITGIGPHLWDLTMPTDDDADDEAWS